MLSLVCVDVDIFYTSARSFVSEKVLDLHNIGLDFTALFSLAQAFNFSDYAHKMATVLQGHQGTLKNLWGKGNWINAVD